MMLFSLATTLKAKRAKEGSSAYAVAATQLNPGKQTLPRTMTFAFFNPLSLLSVLYIRLTQGNKTLVGSGKTNHDLRLFQLIFILDKPWPSFFFPLFGRLDKLGMNLTNVGKSLEKKGKIGEMGYFKFTKFDKLLQVLLIISWDKTV